MGCPTTQARLLNYTTYLEQIPSVLFEKNVYHMSTANRIVSFLRIPSEDWPRLFPRKNQNPVEKTIEARSDVLGSSLIYQTRVGDCEQVRLDIARKSGCLDAFLRDVGHPAEELHHVSRDRMSSPRLPFLLGGVPMEVEGIKVAPDAIFHNVSRQEIYPVEAKKGKRDTFSIRQLFTPLLLWARIAPSVRVYPIMFSYEAGVYSFTMYDFYPAPFDMVRWKVVGNRTWQYRLTNLPDYIVE